jgi:hypothetical protein
MAKVTLQTPCGPASVDLPGLPGFPPSFTFDILPLPFPPKFTIPMPDCSLKDHLGSAPEPPEDSVP